MIKSGKLELTWVGKYEEKKIEPRILIEDKLKSYGDNKTENMLIHGDNLLALKALEANFTEKVKTVYIDPPFNTGQAFEHYDDGVEHSIWLDLMYRRLQIIYNLLSGDGTIFIHIDDNELGYLLVLMDEIFGRSNRLYIVTFKQGAATGHKAINPGCVTNTNYIVMYAKDKSKWKPNKIYTSRDRDKRYSQYILNYDEGIDNWDIVTLTKGYALSLDIDEKEARKRIKKNPEEMDMFVMKNPERVIRTARPDYKNVSAAARESIDKSKERLNSIIILERDGLSNMLFRNGERILFYKDKLKLIDGELIAGEPLTTLWDDILSNNLHKEGEVSFPKSKKPEYLIKRILEMSSNEGDIVLDSFLGSGTTIAVAHKMNRKWIGIEMGEHCNTHCLPRIKRVIDNIDTSGVTKVMKWSGGGGVKFYELAESLLVKNTKLPVYSINPSYSFEMVVEAICKIEGFEHKDFGQFNGKSSENRFIHVTDDFVNSKYIYTLIQNLNDKQSLIIYCTKSQSDIILPSNVELKKIPKDLLEKCVFESEVK